MNIRRWILIIFPFIFLLYLSITPVVLAEKKEQPILKIEFKDGKFVKTETTREEEERKRKEGKKEKSLLKKIRN
ncbi:hypothetical protein [Ammoniphilus sp. CFH 90114]|uniref:hypothetical protein n=1 Tax=Ammoniphilus sp. CFH 90114 TaxID=2493665 RepID=UPI00100E4228|nr:hypothetical protein [Ammoniphilus sp. CFH 90114]RXT07245.1 hypothetical protein EIZ39_13970 [Ammoniphilus sp. CFH 90114]